MKLRFSLAGRIAFLTSVLLVVVTAAGAVLTRVLEPWWLAWIVALLIALPLLWIGIHRLLKPSVRLMRALTDGTESLKDHDFSISIADRASDELGELVAAHNQLGSALRDEPMAPMPWV